MNAWVLSDGQLADPAYRAPDGPSAAAREGLAARVAGGEAPATPVAPEVLGAFARSRGVQAAAGDFRRKACFIVQQGQAPDSQFPSTVVYPTFCRGICCQDPLRAWHVKLVASFIRCVQQLGGPAAQVSQKDAILAIAVYTDAQKERGSVRFVALGVATGRWGHHEPTQTFAALDCVEGDAGQASMDRLTLRFRLSAFATPDKRLQSPMERQTLGPLQTYSENELAVSILKHQLPEIGGMLQQVVIRRVLYQDIDLKTVVSCGEDHQFEAIRIAPRAPGSEAGQRGGGRRGRGRGHGRSGGSLDLCSDFTKAQSWAGAGSRSRRTAGPGPGDPGGKAAVAQILMTSEEMVEGTFAELAPQLLLAEGADGFVVPGTDPTEEQLQATLDQEAARWIPEADEPAAASGAETPLDAEEGLVPSGPAQAGVAPVVAEDALFHPANHQLTASLDMNRRDGS